jgi:hypothetical protein
MNKRTAIALATLAFFLVTIACGGSATPTIEPVAEQPAEEEALPTQSSIVENTPVPIPTNTPAPTRTPLPPPPTSNPNLIRPGTYLVGTDIQPGIYKGQGGESLFSSCYWQRMSDLSGGLESILANDNAIGQFYVEVGETDFAFETACDMTRLDPLPEPPNEYPTLLMPGMYLIGVDIQPGTYRGEGGQDIMTSCYWARLTNVAGDLDSIIANDNAIGQFYVTVSVTDFALDTACELTFVGE